jgi:hypothetical protein
VILAMAQPGDEREFRLRWSLWRRAHQAVAKRCHFAKRALLRAQSPGASQRAPATKAVGADTAAPMSASLTDEQWARVESLLPPRKPPRGRPRREHHAMLAGMLWVLGNGASWRDLPEEEFGPWQTVYDRYRKWGEDGLWQQIVDALRC